MIKTFAQARAFVLKEKICTIFSCKTGQFPSLWDTVDLPDKQPGEGGWGEKISAVWTWKNQLPQTFPDEIFYGKIKGGQAVLMDLQYLREVHYPKAHQSLSSLSPLAQQLYAFIRLEPWETGNLRKLAMQETACSKSQFDSALKALQVSLNIVRAIDPDADRDRWVPFHEVYPQIASAPADS